MSRALLALTVPLLVSAAALAATAPGGTSGAGAKDPSLVSAAELHRQTFGLLAKAATDAKLANPMMRKKATLALHNEAVEMLGRLDVLGNKCLQAICKTHKCPPGGLRLRDLLQIAARDNGPADPLTMCVESCEYDAETLRLRFPELATQRIPMPRVPAPRINTQPLLDSAYGLHLDTLYALLHAKLGRNDVDVIRLERKLINMEMTCVQRSPVQIKGLCIDHVATDLAALEERFPTLGASPTAMMAAKGRARGKLLRRGQGSGSGHGPQEAGADGQHPAGAQAGHPAGDGHKP